LGLLRRIVAKLLSITSTSTVSLSTSTALQDRYKSNPTTKIPEEPRWSGWDYSKEFVELGLLPIASLENDKVCCFDCIYYGFVVLQLNFGTIEPLRKYILFRANDFMKFVELLNVLP
jgi:hypothetical protein